MQAQYLWLRGARAQAQYLWLRGARVCRLSSCGSEVLERAGSVLVAQRC